ncbi:hypothetical protein SprV_0100034000 [Sparganum proliferum]
MIGASAGWNDPPKLPTTVNNSGTQVTKRNRGKVFHSIDGNGPASHSSSAANYNAVPSALVPQPNAFSSNFNSDVPTTPQPPSTVGGSCPQMYAPRLGQPPIAAVSSSSLPPAGPLHYDDGSTFTITQLTTQISRVFRNPSLDIPGRDAILSSLTSLQTELASGRLSASVQVLLRNLFSFIQQNDYEHANETINALSSNHGMEVQGWLYAVQQLMFACQTLASWGQ